MKRTLPGQPRGHPPWWQVSETWEFNGKPVVRGQRLTVTGVRGEVFAFINHTVAPPRPGSGKRTTREWVTVLGESGFRSFRPDRIRRVLAPPRKPRARTRQ